MVATAGAQYLTKMTILPSMGDKRLYRLHIYRRYLLQTGALTLASVLVTKCPPKAI